MVGTLDIFHRAESCGFGEETVVSGDQQPLATERGIQKPSRDSSAVAGDLLSINVGTVCQIL